MRRCKIYVEALQLWFTAVEEQHLHQVFITLGVTVVSVRVQANSKTGRVGMKHVSNVIDTIRVPAEVQSVTLENKLWWKRLRNVQQSRCKVATFWKALVIVLHALIAPRPAGQSSVTTSGTTSYRMCSTKTRECICLLMNSFLTSYATAYWLCFGANKVCLSRSTPKVSKNNVSWYPHI